MQLLKSFTQHRHVWLYWSEIYYNHILWIAGKNKKQNLNANDNFNYLKVFVFFCIWQGPTSDRPLPHGTLRSPCSYVVPSKHLQTKKQDNIIIHFQQTLCVCYTLLECQQRPAMRSIFIGFAYILFGAIYFIAMRRQFHEDHLE